MNRIFVTALSIISNVGTNIDDYWKGINSTEEIRQDMFNFPVILPNNIENKVARRMSRFSLMTLCASKLALENTLIQPGDYEESRIGTVFTTGYGPIDSIITYGSQLKTVGIDLVSPTLFTNTVYNSGIGHTCLNLKLKGVSTLLMGSNAVAYASELLKSGKADAILCGGVEEYNRDLYESFQQKEYITQDNEYLCRPLDRNRSGTRITEGAGILLLENENALIKYPERILSEIIGYASLSAGRYMAKDYENSDIGVFNKVMRLALDHASIQVDEIDGILMAAGGGRFSDKAEAMAIHEVFGSRAAGIPVASIKGAIGETMGASFSINMVTASIAISKGCMPSTAGCVEPDSALGLNIVHHQEHKGDYRYIMVNGYDVSGNVYSAIIGKARG